MSEKPVIFISHSSKDGAIANCIKKHLDPLLYVEIFETSHFTAIEGSEEWREKIIQKLNEASALLVLNSYNSKFSQWVHWEIGYFENRRLRSDTDLPVYIATIGGEEPFATVNFKQAKSLNDADEIRHLFGTTIASHFDETIEQSQLDDFVNELESIVPVHIIGESTIEKMKDFLKFDYQAGRWIDYLEMDRELRLPNVTCQNHLLEIVRNGDDWEIQDKKSSGCRLKKDRTMKFGSAPSDLFDTRD